jgi:hypothetical protein
MNRIKTVNEIVTLLEAEYPGENINPEHELDKKVKPLVSVICSSEDIHESIRGASEMDIDFMVEINDEDGGGVDFDALTAFVCNDAFKDALTATGELTCHRVELSGTELERENTTSKQTLAVKLWAYS